MSNALAISTVSAALRRRVLAAAVTAVDDAKTRMGAPTAKLGEDGKALVNIHLYRVEPNPMQANAHLPNRNSAGLLRNASQLALNLHYIVSFYGDNDIYEPDHMLAAVMLALEHEPELSRQTISRTIDDDDDLSDSNLNEALARLRVTRELMDLDDFSKIWSIFYQVPYALSLSYVVSHVLIETADRSRAALPVAQAGLWVAPLADLRLDTISGARDRLAPSHWTGTLHVTGVGLGRIGLELEVDGSPVAMGEVVIEPDRLALPLADATFGGAPLRVGLHGLRAIGPKSKPDMPDYLRPRSNILSFPVHPTLTSGTVALQGNADPASGTVKASFTPPIGKDQEVRLLLDLRNATVASQHILPASERNGEVSEITFSFSDLPQGDYLMRADVDGLLSQVAFDTDPDAPTFGQINGPLVTI